MIIPKVKNIYYNINYKFYKQYRVMVKEAQCLLVIITSGIIYGIRIIGKAQGCAPDMISTGTLI